MKLSEIIKRELDPRRDFERVKPLWDYLKEYENKPSIKSFSRAFEDAIYWYVNGFIKSIGRYSLPVAGLGALGAYVVGENPNTWAILLGTTVAGIDASQYSIRGTLIPIARDIFNFLRKSSNNTPFN